MFNRISGVYDLLNRLLSFNLDRLWRRHLARAALRAAGNAALALDVCCGTGDTSIALAREICHNGLIVGVDFAEKMLERMRRKVARAPRGERIRACLGDAARLPFAAGVFDAVCCGFGVRNLPDRRRGLREMLRVLKPGGAIAVMEFARPEHGGLGGAAGFYVRRILPVIGRLISGDEFNAYGYLPESIMKFPTAEEFRRDMLEAGCGSVEYEVNRMGLVAFLFGSKG